jgi:ATP synthase protein I
MHTDSDDDRFDDLEQRLKRARHEHAESDPSADGKNRSPLTGIGLAFRVSVELISGVAVGGGIGWGLDQWLGTKPWLMMVFLLLGGAAGMLNVYRLSTGYGYAAGYKKSDDDAGKSGTGDQGN